VSASASSASCLRLAVPAMASRFECVLPRRTGTVAEEARLRAAGEAALAEVVATEHELSRFRDDSVLSRILARARRSPALVPPRLWEVLTLCDALVEATGGRFDPAAAYGGWRCVVLDRRERTLRLDGDTGLDFGAIGKGVALDRAAEALREAGVRDALLHGGASSVFGLGRDPEGRPWRIALADPGDAGGVHGTVRATVVLADRALGVSAPRQAHPERGVVAHVLDPATGRAVTRGPTRLAAVRARSAAAADAWATALVVGGRREVETLDLEAPMARPPW